MFATGQHCTKIYLYIFMSKHGFNAVLNKVYIYRTAILHAYKYLGV